MPDQQCWDMRQGSIIIRGGYAPCASAAPGVVVPCCYIDHVCMDNNFCSWYDTANNKSSYYVAGCTDPSFADPACRTDCSGHYLRDATWNWRQDQKSWSCCGADPQGNAMCNPPAGPDFTNAPGQLLLRPLASINAASSAVPLTDAPASASATAVAATVTVVMPAGVTTSISNSQPTSDGRNAAGLSLAGILAIVIGITAFLSWILGGLYLFKKRKPEGDWPDHMPISPTTQQMRTSKALPNAQELDGQNPPGEMSGQISICELSPHQQQGPEWGSRGR